MSTLVRVQRHTLAVSAATLCVVWFFAWPVISPGSAAAAQDELVVTNFLGNSVTVYDRTADGNSAPLRTLVGPATGLNHPMGVAQDLVHDELFVANNLGASVTVYARTANGNTAPLRMLTGFTFGPFQVVLDLVHDEMIVLGGSHINVYSRTASGNAAPLRTLQGAATGLSGPGGAVLDLLHDELVVPDYNNNSVMAYARTASGNTPPLRTLKGAATGLSFSSGVALDLVHDELVVSNQVNSSLTVYARTATGNAAPVRTLQGPATGLNFPFVVVLDLVHDEMVVPLFSGSVNIYGRQASGNVAPLRTLSGASTGLNNPEFAALTTNPPLFAALLPLSRSHQFGTLLTAFATIINAGTGPVQQCLIRPPANSPAGLGPVIFQTTDPTTNEGTGTANTPANVPAGGSQTFVFGFTPTAPIAETSLTMNVLCENTAPAARIAGVTDLTLVADTNPVPDTIALMATVSRDGVVRIPDSMGLQLFAIGTANVGATGTITVSADTGGVALPITLTVCETNVMGGCLGSAASTVTVPYTAGTTRSFAFFAQASGPIPLDPAVNRVFARLKDVAGVTRGATSSALCTKPNLDC